ncbi:MAG TPA: hypothetical protein VD815_02565 [Candidatus Saccharimonadales bacterium]|nr:hypothetical protein [Candidatus Saccharimonadales bacterium]
MVNSTSIAESRPDIFGLLRSVSSSESVFLFSPICFKDIIESVKEITLNPNS